MKATFQRSTLLSQYPEVTTEKGLQSCNKSQRCIPFTASEEKRNFKNGGNVRKGKTRIVYFRIIINTKSRDISINIKKSYEEKNGLSVILKFTTAQKMKCSIKDFFSKCDQIPSLLWIWPHLLNKSVMKNFVHCSSMTRAWSVVVLSMFLTLNRFLRCCSAVLVELSILINVHLEGFHMISISINY